MQFMYVYHREIIRKDTVLGPIEPTSHSDELWIVLRTFFVRSSVYLRQRLEMLPCQVQCPWWNVHIHSLDVPGYLLLKYKSVNSHGLKCILCACGQFILTVIG